MQRDDDDEGTSQGQCLVCLSRAVDVRLPCHHQVLCAVCADGLLNYGASCPLCRAKFVAFEVHPRFAEATYAVRDEPGKTEFLEALEAFKLHPLSQSCTTVLPSAANDEEEEEDYDDEDIDGDAGGSQYDNEEEEEHQQEPSGEERGRGGEEGRGQEDEGPATVPTTPTVTNTGSSSSNNNSTASSPSSSSSSSSAAAGAAATAGAAVSSQAPNVQSEKAAIDLTGYHPALELLLRSAQSGYPYAQIYLAFWTIEQWFGVPRHVLQGFKWCKLAAKADFAVAQCLLAHMYHHGICTEQNLEKAIYWYRRSAKLGNSFAYANLGTCHIHGRGVQQDFREAFRLYHQASTRSHNTEAMFCLGVCYYHGLGVKADWAQCLKWTQIAAERQQGAAQGHLSFLYAQGHGVEKDMTQAISWLQKSAFQGFALAQNALGFRLLRGANVPMNAAKGVAWLRLAAAQSCTPALINLAECYENGVGVKFDLGKAKQYRESAKKAAAHDLVDVGGCYEFGIGLDEDNEKAVECYQKAYSEGNVFGFLGLKRLGVIPLDAPFESPCNAASDGNAKKLCVPEVDDLPPDTLSISAPGSFVAADA